MKQPQNRVTGIIQCTMKCDFETIQYSSVLRCQWYVGVFSQQKNSLVSNLWYNYRSFHRGENAIMAAWDNVYHGRHESRKPNNVQ